MWIFKFKKNMAKKKEIKDKRQRALKIIKDIIVLEETKLDTTYVKTHFKVGVINNNNVVEIYEEDHGEKRVIKYNSNEFHLTKKEYKDLMNFFHEEKKNKCGLIKGFEYLEENTFN